MNFSSLQVVLFMAMVGVIAGQKGVTTHAPHAPHASSSTPSSATSSTPSSHELPSSSAPTPSSSTPSQLDIQPLVSNSSGPASAATPNKTSNGVDLWSIYRSWSQNVLSQLGLTSAGILGGSGQGLSSDFNCTNFGNGYYADVERDCRVFYYCYKSRGGDMSGDIVTKYEKITLLCDAGMYFNQKSLSCEPKTSSSDCKSSPQLFASTNNGTESPIDDTTVASTLFGSNGSAFNLFPASPSGANNSGSVTGNNTLQGFGQTISQVFGR